MELVEHIQTNIQKRMPSIENILLGAVINFSNIIVIELKHNFPSKVAQLYVV